MWEWQIDRDRVTHNSRWCELLGLGEEYLVHTMAEFAPLIHAEDRAAATARVQACLAGAGGFAGAGGTGAAIAAHA